MMESKHIAIFLRYLQMGGIQKIALRLANEFAERGHKVDLIVAKGKGALAADVHPEVTLVDLNKSRVWLALPSLLRYVLRRHPQALLSLGFSANVLASALTVLVPYDLGIYISVRSNMSRHSRNDEVWYSRWVPTIIQIVYPLADKIIAVSKGVLEDLSNISPRAASRGCVIYNPVFSSEIIEKAEQPICHPWLQKDGPPVILGVGRLTPQKNFDLLLRSFRRMERDREVRLVILGNGNQRESLEGRIEALDLECRVDLPGFVENPYPYMRRASLLVLSSDYEGLPSVPIQALACGCPVVATDCPSGPREILEDGKWGRLVPVGDEEALAEAMEKSLDEEHDPDHLRQRAMDFSVDKAVDNYIRTLFPGA